MNCFYSSLLLAVAVVVIQGAAEVKSVAESSRRGGKGLVDSGWLGVGCGGGRWAGEQTDPLSY
jgi:hypothetical protein